jgi:mRNA-degrading endonuclease toxin of MazEF toxin-antitoxin module
MKRGDIWTVAGGKDYAGKPRPVVIVQDDSFDATDSITICAFTEDILRLNQAVLVFLGLAVSPKTKQVA